MNWRHLLERHLTRAWLRRGPTAMMLLPVALLYSALNALRRQAYRTGWMRSHRVHCTVVVVGNVIAGGAGKTPTVMAIAQQLQAWGHRVGVVSRGYGRATGSVREVLPDSISSQAGDEPLLLRRALGTPVFVGHDRVEATQTLLAAYPDTTVVLCDDGLQHLRLFRDLEIYVFDQRGVGNGWPLPSGPLRSPWPALWVASAGQQAARALVVHTSGPASFAGHVAQRHLQSYGVDSAGARFPLVELAERKRPCIALAGIAQPQAFFDMLALAGVNPNQCLSLPDHFDFTHWEPPWKDDWTVLCTEKDAVKLWERWPQAIAVPLVQTMDADFWQALRAHLPAPQPALASV